MKFTDMLGQTLEIGNEVLFRRGGVSRKGIINSLLSDAEVIEVSSWAPSEKRFTTFAAESEELLKLDDIKDSMPELFI